MKNLKLDRFYYQVRYEARRVIELKKDFGENLNMANMPMSDDETRNIIRFSLKKIETEKEHLNIYKKYHILDEEKIAAENEILETMKHYLERRLKTLNEIYK